MEMPELYVDESLSTERGWKSVLASYGHVGFSLAGRCYFVFPTGPHAYGMCYYEDSESGNHPRWSFSSEEELLAAQIFDGKSLKDCLAEILYFDV